MSNFKQQQQHHETKSKTRNMVHSKEKNKNNPLKDLVADRIDKSFKTTILKMSTGLKVKVKKVKKMMCEQNGKMSKEEKKVHIGNKKKFWS